MWRLAPLKRQNEPYAKANMAFNPFLKRALQRGQDNGKTYAEIFKTIEDLGDSNDKPVRGDQEFINARNGFWEGFEVGFKPDLAMLSIFITGSDRGVAWNLQNLCVAGKETGTVSGTIEYRRPPPSTSLLEAYRNVTLSLCFAYGAVKFANAGHPVFKYMASTAIVAPDAASRQIPSNMDGFAAAHNAVFQEWMREAAKDLGLEEWLPPGL